LLTDVIDRKKKVLLSSRFIKILLILLGGVSIISACNSDANPEEERTGGTGQLVRAVTRQDLAEVENILMQQGYDVNEVNEKKENPILIATHLNNLEIARKLIDAGANVNMQDEIKDSAYLYAGAQGRTEILRYILEHARPEPDQKVRNRYGGNALIPAAEKGYIENVKLLLADGRVDINLQNEFGYSALIEAVALKDGSQVYQDIVKLLLDGGAKTDLKDRTGKTALDYAEEKGYVVMAQMIKDAGRKETTQSNEKKDRKSL